jgi:hypothetical protein
MSSEADSSSGHPLPYTWEFWVIKSDPKDYEIEPIISFSTVEEFWEYYLQFPALGQLRRGGIGLFKKGIKPAWEDPQNAHGTSVRLIDFPVNRNECWDALVISVISGELESRLSGVSLCGLYAVMKFKADQFTVELWFGQGRGLEDDRVIYQVLRPLDLPDLKVRMISRRKG